MITTIKMSKMSSDIDRNNNMNEAETLDEGPCLVGALWVGSAGPVVIKKSARPGWPKGDERS